VRPGLACPRLLPPGQLVFQPVPIEAPPFAAENPALTRVGPVPWRSLIRSRSCRHDASSARRPRNTSTAAWVPALASAPGAASRIA